MAEIQKKTVLVVDDEPDVRLFLKTVLEDAGYGVMLAATGKEALERTTEKKPDVISLDLVMPKMSGLKFYKYIQKNKERTDIPVVVLTAHAKDEFGRGDLAKIQEAKPPEGVLLVLEKPVQPALYVKTIRAALGGGKAADPETGAGPDLRTHVAEQLKAADRKTLEEVLRILSRKP